MQNIEFILDEAKQKIEAQLGKVRWKVLRFLLFVTFVFMFFFAGWLALWGLPKYMYWGMVIVTPIAFYFIARPNLQVVLWQKYYENQLELLRKEWFKRPQTAADYVERAKILSDLDYHEAAVEDLRNALEMEPDNPDYWDEIVGILWYEMYKGEELLPYVERISEIEGDNQAEAFMIRGQILTTTAPESALASFDKAIEIDPDDMDYRLARLRFFVDTNRLRDAAVVVDEMSKEIQKSYFVSEKAEFAELQGIIAMKQKDPETAVKHFSNAIRFWKNDKYYTLRAEAHDAIGDTTKANADRQKAENLSNISSL
ncbi:MAG: hypothetical protein LBU65_06135 [Planctomycetaceae bacterium]|nr:hypothetical protein [Planctomycetaceae bacterium]